MATHSYWKDVELPTFAALRESIHVDVLVVGGGMTGITTAYLLKDSGRSVALIEKERCAQFDTGNTTAHLTFVTDLRIKQLVDRFGRDNAQAVWDAGQAAILQIEDIVKAEGIDCDFRRVPGFLHASITGTDDETQTLMNEAELSRELSFPAEFVTDVPLFGGPGIRFPNQARFHPLKYLAHLVTRIPGKGCHVFERTEAVEFEAGDAGPNRVTANGQTITCDYLVLATDVPLMGTAGLVSATLLQTKLAGYTSYAIGAKVPADIAPDALFWDTSDPYYYFRVDERVDGQYAIFGGLDHKTGQAADSESRFRELERTLHRFLPQAHVDRHWSGQVIESADGLPMIGETSDRQFVATAFSGNGITFGTLGGMMICDAITGRRNPWKALFAPQRKPIRGGLLTYASELLDYPYYMVKDRLTKSEGSSLRSLKPGEGKILSLNGQRVAAYRDDNGDATVLSPVCTHLGCIVHWNNAEKSWDCPCHGSRFGCTGEVIAGPAESPLERVNPVEHVNR